MLHLTTKEFIPSAYQRNLMFSKPRVNNKCSKKNVMNKCFIFKILFPVY